MNLQEVKTSVGNPLCRKFPATREEWRRVVSRRLGQLEDIFTQSTYPTIGDLEFLWPVSSDTTNNRMLKTFRPQLEVMGDLNLAQQGIFGANDYWPSIHNRSAVGATRWIWGYARPRGWVLAKVIYDMKIDCHGGSLHQCPTSVQINRSSFLSILEAGFFPERIWTVLGQTILSWSQQQQERALRGARHVEEVRAQEAVLAALK